MAPAKSIKRGLAYGHHSAADMNVLSPGMSWWYNWSPKPETAVAAIYKSKNVSFVPMSWNGATTADQLAAAIPDGAQYLLGPNEPNFKSQANMTPVQTAAFWPVLENVAHRKNLKIGAPALNFCGDCVVVNGQPIASDPIVYMDAFMAACQGCQIDFIPVHWYSCWVGALEWYVGKFKKYNKPIWVTEFACGDYNGNPITLQVQKDYMSAAIDYLEHEPAVARYSWFSGRNNEIPFINLLGADGQLTALGQLYVTLPFAAAPKRVPFNPWQLLLQ